MNESAFLAQEQQLAILNDQAERFARAWLELNWENLEAGDIGSQALAFRNLLMARGRRFENDAIAVTQLAISAGRSGTQYAAVELIEGNRFTEGAVISAANEVARFMDAGKEKVLAKLRSAFTKMIMTASRSTVKKNVKKAGTHFARYPEAGACAFCLMLASRGAVYLSWENAQKGKSKERYHEHCKCSIVEVVTEPPQRVRELNDYWERNRDKFASTMQWMNYARSGQFFAETGWLDATFADMVARRMVASGMEQENAALAVKTLPSLLEAIVNAALGQANAAERAMAEVYMTKARPGEAWAREAGFTAEEWERLKSFDLAASTE